MLSTILCLLPLLFISTDGAIHRWGGSDISSRNCIYEFEFEVEDVDGPQETIGGPVLCLEGSLSCGANIIYNKTYTVSHNYGLSLGLQLFRENLDGITSNVNFSLSHSRTLSGTLNCNIGPGFKVSVITRPRYHKLHGPLRVKCEKYVNVYVSPRTGEIREEYPAVDEKKELEILVPQVYCDIVFGNLACFPEQDVNMTTEKKLCNEGKMTTRNMYDAIGGALAKVKINTPINGVKAIEYAHSEGREAWAIGMCWNGIAKAKCSACITKLIDEVWAKCDDAIGAQYWLPDCGVRYELYELTADSYKNSFH